MPRETARAFDINRSGFEAFLACLDTDERRASEKYEQIRSKLINFFGWRGAPFPEDHADESINRVIRKLIEGDSIEDPSTYVYGIARMVLLEAGRQRERQVSLDTVGVLAAPERSEDDEKEARLDCLDRCLSKLPERARDLIREYYRKEKGDKIEHRRKLAEGIGIPVNALRIRALRLRDKLGLCINECLKEARN
jgi:RNA polymerase sigma factor (sigma-70 family)